MTRPNSVLNGTRPRPIAGRAFGEFLEPDDAEGLLQARFRNNTNRPGQPAPEPSGTDLGLPPAAANAGAPAPAAAPAPAPTPAPAPPPRAAAYRGQDPDLQEQSVEYWADWLATPPPEPAPRPIPEPTPLVAPPPPITAAPPDLAGFGASTSSGSATTVVVETDSGTTQLSFNASQQSFVAPPPPAPPAPIALAAPYVGERPADPAWLNNREAALLAVRRDYESQRIQAQTNVPSFDGAPGPGWQAFTPSYDHHGNERLPAGQVVVEVQNPNAGPAYYGEGDNAGFAAPPSQRFVFNEAAFTQHYQTQAFANPNSALQTLARRSYDTDAAALLNAHPELWDIALRDPTGNAGPAQAGRAMASLQMLAPIEMLLADPQNRALIQAYGGTPEPATSPVALEQVRIYGAARSTQMTRLATAMQTVRDQYAQAVEQAANNQGGPGWRLQPQTVSQYAGSGDDGDRYVDVVVMQPSFDVDAFTTWYQAQPGLTNQAFKDNYGASHTTAGGWVDNGEGSGTSYPSSTSFDNADWHMSGFGGALAHTALTSIDPNNHPSLNDDAIVGFDPVGGWITPTANLHQKQDWVFTAAIVAMVVIVSCVTYGAASEWAVGAGYSAAAGAVGGAAAGAASSFVSGAMNGNLSFKGVLQGALAGALTGAAGDYLKLGTIVDPALVAPGTVGGFVSNFTINTAVHGLMQGKITDEMLLTNLASAAGQALSVKLSEGISDAVKKGAMSATEAFAAQAVAKVLTAAVRAMASPDDPSYAFANALLSEVMQPLGDAARDAGSQGVRDARDIEGARQSDEILARRGNELLGNGAAAQGPVNTAGNTPNASSNTYAPPQAPGDLMGPGPLAQGEPSAGPSPNGAQQIIVTGRALPRDADGNRLYIDAQGNGQVLLSGGGIVSLGSLSPELARELASTATLGGSVLMRINTGVALGAGAGTGATALGEVLTAGRALVGGAIDTAGRMVGNAGLGLAESLVGTSAGALATGGLLLVVPSQIGQQTDTYLGSNTRFVQQSDMVYGQLQERNAQGDWEVLRTDVRRYEVMGRTVVLSDDELARLNRPIATPMPPPQLNGPPPLPAWVDNNRPNPGYVAAPAGPTTLVNPATPQPTAANLIIERNRAEQRRFRNALIDEARRIDPNFDPTGFDAHHGIPLTDYPRLNGLRAQLANWGIDLNDTSVNGVLLPRGRDAPGTTSHTDTQNNPAYSEEILDRFRGVESKGRALEVLGEIRQDLRDGNFVEPRTRGD